MPTSSPWSTLSEDMLWRTLVRLLTIVLIFFFGFKAWNAAAEHRYIGSVVQRDTITLDGDGKVSGQPSLARIDMGIFTEGSDVAQVQQQNIQQMNAVVSALKTLGLADADIQTSQYFLAPKYDYTHGQQIIGYSLSQNVTLKIRDLTKVSAILAKASQLNINRINNVEFTIDDPTVLQQQAREKAIKEAQQKADQLARVMGVNLGRVVGFTEGTVNNPPWPRPMMAQTMGAVASAAPEPNVQAGSLDVVSHVSVTFEIK